MSERKRVLIGEDDASILKMTKIRLEHEGFDAITAEDGQEVLEQAASHLPIPRMLLDLMLPKLNGYQVCQRLKRPTPTAGIPVIVFSASENHLSHLADRCIEVGANDWIKKPFRTKDLMVKIYHLLGEEGSSHG